MKLREAPVASTATIVMPAVVSGGLARPIWFSSPSGTSSRGLVRYQKKSVSGRTVFSMFHRSGAVDVASMYRA